FRSEYNVPAGEAVTAELTHAPDHLRTALDAEERALRRLADVDRVVYPGDGGARTAGAHAVLRSG
ncbi:MAG: hypothetical protein GWM90_16945, partial [Gemmatimonadetes bacterium]|nr:hypothetical protein [Gemmatimonadota bacterium]NIQ55990.1 hypothetical protein [Gemmatimonadota bacterium]NIU76190.1 hypothetical protein [Gammaproteobacteria bacterium]NIX45719.1 hypothetical protein [Gemmatimonadota bacterium]NIY10025.1 hypothetical protein [Gemmatimonadota bacterium]